MYSRYKSKKENMCWGSKRTHPGTVIHWHEFYEVECLVKGNARLSINGTTVDAQDGYLAFLSPLDFHHIEPTDGKRLILSVCDIKEEAIPEELRTLLKEYKPPYLLKIEPDSEIMRMLDYFDTAFVKNGDETSAKYAAHLIISLLVREVMQNKNLLSPSEFVASDAQIKSVRMILQYIDLHYNERITREELAEQFNYSPVYLSKLFKRVTGEKLFDHIIGVRMKMAQKLISDTDKSIGEIIKDVGYNSPSLFYKHYYDRYKTMPYASKTKK
ncbi:MAG: helix-turn-helix transcriptional regulator [Clostridia bacterium]|nr:helix-turn-helix transcriptional regulator [Clostridia bacterium]